jgi:hypothetical protein
MTTRPAGRATARELAIVFAGLLLAALGTSRLRAAVLAVAPDGVRSLLVAPSLGTLAFAGLRAAGGYRLAWVMTALLAVALVGSSAAAVAGKRIAPVGPPPMKFAPEPPARRAEVADLFGDRPQTWTFLAPSVTIRADQHVVIAADADASFSYLAFTKSQHFDADDLLVVEGVVESGGFTLGIWQDNAWIAYTSIVEPGAFRSWVAVPREGDYLLGIANVGRAHVPTRVELSSLKLRQ